MIALEINGQMAEWSFVGCSSFEDVVARIREERSPNEVVSSAWWNGSPLSDVDLERDPLTEHGTLAIVTRQRRAYVSERLDVAQRYVGQISDSFQQSIHAFQTGHSGFGNTFLARGIDELLSFVAWYSTIINLEASPESSEPNRHRESFFSTVRAIQLVCERLVSAQLLESSFTIAKELEKHLFPELQRLGLTCQAIARERHSGEEILRSD